MQVIFHPINLVNKAILISDKTYIFPPLSDADIHAELPAKAKKHTTSTEDDNAAFIALPFNNNADIFIKQ